MKWVTRRGIKVNRAATAWLIRTFVDDKAVFVFVEAAEVASYQKRKGAAGFDAPGATYPTRDDKGRCSFEALVDEHRPTDHALRALARIVHAAELGDDVDQPVLEASGLRAISDGAAIIAKSDDEIVERTAFLFDALYASLQDRTVEDG